MKQHLLLLLVIISIPCIADADNTYNIMDYGAVGDGTTDDAVAIQAAIDTCGDNGGGTVIIPSNHTFVASPLQLRSYVTLYVESSATLRAITDESCYTLSAFGDNRGEGMMWLYGQQLTHVTIAGTGTIDGSGTAFMTDEGDDAYELKPVIGADPRPHLLTLIEVDKVVIRDVTFSNSAYWTIHLAGCSNVTIDGIAILNNIKVRNGDGIDVDHSKHVRISNCYIESGDDSICLKNRREYAAYGSCEDILVTNCTMQSRSCAFKIGSENVDAIRDVVVDNCIIRESNRGIGIQNRDEGTVSNILFSNIIVNCHYFSDVWWGKAEPIYVTAFPRATVDSKDGNVRFPPGATQGYAGEVHNITFSNIRCTSENGIFIAGDTPGKVHDITLNDVDLTLVKTTDYPSGRYDKRPCDGDEFILADPQGILLDTTNDVNINNFSLHPLQQ